MTPRNILIAALVVIELAIVELGVESFRTGQPVLLQRRAEAGTPYSGRLVEDGPHRLFRVGARPELTVDVGYADLTVLTGKPEQIDVGLSGSTDFGTLRETALITATGEGDSVRIASIREHRWSAGDDRMVTVVVPPQTRVTVVHAGDIKASGLRADATFKSVGRGSIAIEDFVGTALDVASSNGAISLRRIVAGRLDATSKRDRIEGSALQVRDGSIQADDDVRLGLAAGSDSLVSAATDGGKVNLLGVSTVASEGASRQKRHHEEDAASETLRVGMGSGRLDVHSNDGDIELQSE